MAEINIYPIIGYSHTEYERNKCAAKLFRSQKQFKTALKYYAAAQIHLKYYKLLTN